MYFTVFDRRRPLLPTVGLPRDHAAAQPFADLAPILERPGARARLLADPTPLPAPDDREGYYGERHLDYWLSGLRDWWDLRAAMPAAAAPGRPLRYLDLGGSTGRVARHAAMDDDVEAWLTDINVNWIDWVDRHFARPVRAFQARLHPTLPIPDGFFDVVSAFSVFTHLDTDERHWLLELLRVVRPGGRLYLTVNDEHVWALLRDPAWAWLRDSLARGVEAERFRALVEAGPIPNGGRLVWTYSDAEGYNTNVFVTSAQIRAGWGRFADVLDYRVAGHNYQSVVVLQKRA